MVPMWIGHRRNYHLHFKRSWSLIEHYQDIAEKRRFLNNESGSEFY